jgi:transcriptional antiterminator NusG
MSKKRGNTAGMVFEARRVIDPTRCWYAVNVLTAREGGVAEGIEEAGGDVWLPKFRTVVPRRGKRHEVERRFFPGYVFVGLESADDMRRVLLDTDGVLGVLGNPDPARIPAGVVQAVADRLTGNVKSERVQAAALYVIGEMRPVVFGPFASFLAQISEVLQTGRIKAEVSIFGRATPCEFEPRDLGPPLTSASM